MSSRLEGGNSDSDWELDLARKAVFHDYPEPTPDALKDDSSMGDFVAYFHDRTAAMGVLFDRGNGDDKVRSEKIFEEFLNSRDGLQVKDICEFFELMKVSVDSTRWMEEFFDEIFLERIQFHSADEVLDLAEIFSEYALSVDKFYLSFMSYLGHQLFSFENLTVPQLESFVDFARKIYPNSEYADGSVNDWFVKFSRERKKFYQKYFEGKDEGGDEGNVVNDEGGVVNDGEDFMQNDSGGERSEEQYLDFCKRFLHRELEIAAEASEREVRFYDSPIEAVLEVLANNKLIDKEGRLEVARLMAGHKGCKLPGYVKDRIYAKFAMKDPVFNELEIFDLFDMELSGEEFSDRRIQDVKSVMGGDLMEKFTKKGDFGFVALEKAVALAEKYPEVFDEVFFGASAVFEPSSWYRMFGEVFWRCCFAGDFEDAKRCLRLHSEYKKKSFDVEAFLKSQTLLFPPTEEHCKMMLAVRRMAEHFGIDLGDLSESDAVIEESANYRDPYHLPTKEELDNVLEWSWIQKFPEERRHFPYNMAGYLYYVKWHDQEAICRESVEDFANYLNERFPANGKERRFLDLGAGSGRLSWFLNKALEEMGREDIQFIAVDMIERDDDWPYPVEQIDYKEALEKYSPEFVLSSWMPRYSKWGDDIRATDSVVEYVQWGHGGITGGHSGDSEGFDKVRLEDLEKNLFVPAEYICPENSHILSYRRAA